MKTLTEFAASTLKNASKTKADLTQAGKTAEELPAALGEALKLEGDKLTRLIDAVDVVGDKFNDLKRVLVFQLAEGEKQPPGAVQKGDLWFQPEQFVSMAPKAAPGRDDRGGRGDKRGGKRGDGKRGGPGGGGAPGGRGRDDRGGGGRGPRGPAVGATPSGPPKITPRAQAPAAAAPAAAATDET